ncbi:MAG: hypothetical protein JO154_01390 [Chitinophaga sp.]|uniref:hypothetical protein n=1 Tax=Chitinophaga sp. TaxID=1869181 RepID=UPI0025C6FF08|nr:hypothetical protein [Chitinophaga sp.]MBV8251231.1 hypothetical protein [Chitinophaga sp.]
MNKRYLMVALIGIMAACKDQPKQQGNPVDAVAFKNFVQSLPYVQTPLAHPEFMSLVKEMHTIEDTATQYDDLRAGRIRTTDDVIVVFYYGEQKKNGHFWVTSYSADGHKLEQTEVGEKIDEDGTSKYVNRVVMENDSIIEFRKYYSATEESYNAFHPDQPSEIRFLAVRPGGKLIWKKAEKESFQRYLSNFEKLSLPLNYEDTPETTPFQQAYRGGSWLDYGGLLSTTFPKAAKLGKLEIPGNPTMVLVKVSDMDTGGDLESYGPSLMLVAYNPQGIETDRVEVTGSYSTEGFESSSTKFNMEQDGSFSFLKSSSMGQYGDGYSAVDEERMAKFTISPAGRFIKNYADIKYVVKDFDPTRSENVQDTTQSDFLGRLEDWKMALFIHTYQEKAGKLVRLITTDPSGHILGSTTLLNTLGNEVKAPTAITDDYLHYAENGSITGTVTVAIDGKTYVVAKDGSITPQ